MHLGSLKRQFGSQSYDLLDEDADTNTNRGTSIEKSFHRYKSSQNWLLYCFFTLLAITITLAAVTGCLFYRLHLSNRSESSQVEGTVARGTLLSKIEAVIANFSPTRDS